MIEIVDDDPVRIYSLEEQQRLTLQLQAITSSVHEGQYRDRALDLRLLCDFHRKIFEGVRDHAGRHRCRDFGSEHPTFGPHRSVRRDHVERELEGILNETRRGLRALSDDPEGDDYELQAIRLAVRAHARLIQVHPFEDGNGRTGRLFASHLLVLLGLRPVPIEVVKVEYTAALNHFYLERDLDPLVDLYIERYPRDRLPEGPL